MQNWIIKLFVAVMIVFALTGCTDKSLKETSEETSDDNSPEIEIQQDEVDSDQESGASREATESTQEERDETHMVLLIDRAPVEVVWEDNDSVTALKELIKDAPIEIQMSMYGGFEQVGPLGIDLPRNDVQITTEAGDIVLYQGNQIVVFYGSNSWAYTRLGHVDGKTAEELSQLLGQKDVTLTLEIN